MFATLCNARCAGGAHRHAARATTLLVTVGVLGLPIAARAAPPSVSELLARAIAYEHGEGLPKDPLIAAATYCDAARAGSAEAAFRLGWMYANGRGVEHDEEIAAGLFRLAAERGDEFARRTLQRLGDLHGRLPDCVTPPEASSAATAGEDASEEAANQGADPFVDLPPFKQKVADVVTRVAPSYGIDPRLALAIIAVESNFDPMARSIKDARGLMQLIPETAARFKVRNRFDMLDNVRGGLAYLRWLLAYYRGEVRLAAAAYNAGEKAVDRFGGVPPYPETRDYVRRVVKLFHRERHPFDPNVTAPSVIATRADH